MSPLNIVIPMAGLGSRFAKAGYTVPKPLIPVAGVPMIRLVIDNVRPRCDHRFIFVCQQEHLDRFDLAPQLQAWAPGCAIVTLNGLTEGAACTVLAARGDIDLDAPLMIANSDQWIDVSIDDYLAAGEQQNADGLIMTMRADDPKWSFVGLSGGLVTRVVEKEVISDEATVGIYNFRSGRDFVDGAEAMIAQNLRVNGEFYVAPVYNLLIERGYRVVTHRVGAVGEGMYGLGIPADLEFFLASPVLQKAVGHLR